MSIGSITIVGFGLAGLRLAESLRRLGFTGSIHAIGDEPHEPYDRPPLSKDVLTAVAEPTLALRTEPIGSLDLDLRLGRRAEMLDVDNRSVTLDDGTVLRADAVVIASGARARRLPPEICPPGTRGVHVLRTLDDARALRHELEAGPRRVAIVGAGFIGMEVASSCRARGLEVVVIEPLPQPMVRGLGEVIGGACAQLHRDHGVELRLGTGVAGVDSDGLTLSDATRVDADVVVVGIGAVPNVEWLGPSGLELGDGIRCDATLAAAAGVFAIGDVANFPNPLFDCERMRLEHWTNAAEMAVHIAGSLTSDEARDFAPVPFVWSDQYDVKIQSVGRFDAQCEVHVAHGTLEERRFVALFGRADRIVGALGFSQPRRVMQYRRMIAERSSWSDALAAAAE